MTFYTICFVAACLVMHVWLMQNMLKFVENVRTFFSFSHKYTAHFIDKNKSNGWKYILLWIEYYLIVTHNGENIFSGLNCPVRNCVFTIDKNLLGGDYSLFDAVLFSEELTDKHVKPVKRSNSQLYIFTTVESSYTQPMCEVYSENFFNWTFTYRLDSDVPWLYYVVTNTSGAVIAPSVSVKWKISMEPVKPEIAGILERKRKTAAWLVSHCRSDSFRDDYLTRLQEHLSHYALKIDVYGKCTKNHCPNYNCNDMIKRDYRFYMAFENSLSEDYVTEKILHAYNNYAVPVVYGGANYSRLIDTFY